MPLYTQGVPMEQDPATGGWRAAPMTPAQRAGYGTPAQRAGNPGNVISDNWSPGAYDGRQKPVMPGAGGKGASPAMGAAGPGVMPRGNGLAAGPGPQLGRGAWAGQKGAEAYYKSQPSRYLQALGGFGGGQIGGTPEQIAAMRQRAAAIGNPGAAALQGGGGMDWAQLGPIFRNG